MAGYIGSKASVTLVDGYTRTEADDEFVSATSGGTFSGNITAPKFSTSDSKIETSIFRVNAQSLTADTTIDADENASATGPLTVASGVTLTVTTGGRLSIV